MQWKARSRNTKVNLVKFYRGELREMSEEHFGDIMYEYMYYGQNSHCGVHHSTCFLFFCTICRKLDVSSQTEGIHMSSHYRIWNPIAYFVQNL